MTEGTTFGLKTNGGPIGKEGILNEPSPMYKEGILTDTRKRNEERTFIENITQAQELGIVNLNSWINASKKGQRKKIYQQQRQRHTKGFYNRKRKTSLSKRRT